MVGSAILRNLKNPRADSRDFEIITRSRQELDLTNQAAVSDFMQSEQPDVVIIAAAKVGRRGVVEDCHCQTFCHKFSRCGV